MKCSRLNLKLVLTVLSVSLLSSFVVLAQESPNIVQIRKVTGSKVATPQYQLLKGQVVARSLDWYQIVAHYETAPDWVDELSFTYYVLVKSKAGKFSLFKGDVTYVNIARGRHLSDIYLHPSTLARFGTVERVAVLINSQGRMLAMESLPSSNARWWEQSPVPPVDGLVLNRMETPFAMMNFDDYEAIKMRK
ncbi:MAG TPA: hypothetical protein DCZ95_12760 [Verrucomicrobia bacterium]|nr:MAG: hypothetical protein A2X46_11900 [Lentisphaerae bacterium GWF2_57_35]HBA84958.1 hypothetical protein [Verrucomicrobiota bacterium]